MSFDVLPVLKPMLVKDLARQKSFPVDRVCSIGCYLGEPGLGAESDLD